MLQTHGARQIRQAQRRRQRPYAYHTPPAEQPQSPHPPQRRPSQATHPEPQPPRQHQQPPQQPKSFQGADLIDYFTRWISFMLITIAISIVGITILFGALVSSCAIFGYPPIHGETFAEFCANAPFEEVEYAAGFTPDGRALYETTSDDPKRVTTPGALILYADVLTGHQAINVHTHPKASAAVHSTIDVINAAARRPAQSIVVSRTSYCVLEAPNGWPEVAAVEQYLAEATRKVEAEHEFVSYCLDEDYIELFNYHDIAVDFLETFGLEWHYVPFPTN